MLHERRFRDFPGRQKPEILRSREAKEPRLERGRSTFRAELCCLRLSKERRKAPGEGTAVLSIPTSALAAHSSADRGSESQDGLADRSASKIRPHEALLRQGGDRFRHGLLPETWQTAS